MATVFAMQAEGPGARLSMAERPTPAPGPGEARIRVAACGVNFADTLMVAGRYQERPEYPLIPGLEVAGEVAELGPDTQGPPPGTRVAALCGNGGYAEEVCAPAAACVPVPEGMPSEHAASLLVAYGTADLALRHRARLQPGETLLVLGAAGGVGLTAVEVGKLLGARVIACARTESRLSHARERGADVTLAVEADGLRDAVREATNGRGADVVFDPVGGDMFRAAMRATAFEGRLIPIGFASGIVPQIPANILLVKNLTAIGLYWGIYFRHRPEVLGESVERILDWYQSNRIRPHIGRSLPLSRAEEALEALRNRESTGKIVLRCREG